MNLRKIILPVALVLLGLATAYLMNRSAAPSEHEQGEEAKGPHRGRLLVDGDFAVELAIFESGVPPEFRAWFASAGKPLDPSLVKLSVELKRPGGFVERYAFSPVGEFSRGDHEVAEPHSFDYLVQAEHAGVVHRWTFAAPEMRTAIDGRTAESSGVRVAVAGAAELPVLVEAYGRVGLDLESTRKVVSRFVGVVAEVRKSVGDKVAPGEVLARIENTQTLVVAEVLAPRGGTVVTRAFSVGDAVAEGDVLFVVADLGRLWLELEIPKAEAGRVRAGQPVVVAAQDGGPAETSRIVLVSPLISPESQSLAARVVLPNEDGHWRPGMFVRANVATGSHRAAVVVRAEAVQNLDDKPVVFSRHGDVYQGRPVRLGRRSGELVEVERGLAAGETYVTEGSYLIKADIAKAGASHDH